MKSDITVFAIENQFLWAGTTDGCILILNHEVLHSCMQSNSRLILYSFQFQTIKSIKAHRYGVGSILNLRGQMWTSSFGHDIRVWTKKVKVSISKKLSRILHKFLLWKEGEGWRLAAHLEGGHKGTVFKLLVAHGYVWSEAADGTRILWKPFVLLPSPLLDARTQLTLQFRCGNMRDMLWERTKRSVLDQLWLGNSNKERKTDSFG